MSQRPKPSRPADIRVGDRGKTEEWGHIYVTKIEAAIVTFEASGGAGKPGIYETTRSILFEQCEWK